MATPMVATTRRERRAAERAARPRGHRRARSTGGRLNLQTLSLAGLLGGMALVAVAIVFGSPPSDRADDTEMVVAVAPAGVATDGFVLGSPDAPVTIELFEDFQCPACAAWSRTVFPLLATNELAAGTVKIVFHDMAFLGTESADAGRAAYAAAQQGRFWDIWATLYANQGRENSGAFSRARLLAMAHRLGLDEARFQADMDSAAAAAAIEASRAAARGAGITSTPTLIVGGEVLVGVQPYPELAAAIAAAAR